ncbi:MAG: hypothetical protein NC205_01000 [Prevotella sp.]|nr:hypothetical protein [Alistipes senegalensis]MCM1357141.1 hypothetical protein [Prevotella sp.]MCM1472652.1 hypothetical protein [Muribaculaceae bacterium]
MAETDRKIFRAAVRREHSGQAENAEKQEKNVTYTITTQRNIELKFNDLIKRKSDGKIFRITSDGLSSPETSGLDMRQVTAEERLIL